LIFAAAVFCAPASAMTPAGCAGGVEIARAKIVRVEKNGALILSDGRAAMLEGIRLPFADNGPPALAGDAMAALKELAMAAPLTLTATAPKEDRYDRVRVQAFGDVWLQAELLRRGLARVQIAADRQECAADFYRIEKEARAAGRGLWAFAAFAPRQADAMPAGDGDRRPARRPDFSGFQPGLPQGLFRHHRGGRRPCLPPHHSTARRTWRSYRTPARHGGELWWPLGNCHLQSGADGTHKLR
jgi:hypothetical protein